MPTPYTQQNCRTRTASSVIHACTVIYRHCTTGLADGKKQKSHKPEAKKTGIEAELRAQPRARRAYMAGLQRSSETFRRSGSSGTVWEEKHQSASGELAKPAQAKEAPPARQQRSGSSGHGGYRTGNVQPALDPPSPRVAACGFCSLFGKDKQPPPRGARGNGKGRRR